MQILDKMKSKNKYYKVTYCCIDVNESAQNMYEKSDFKLTGDRDEDEIGSRKRIDIPEIPEKTIREIVVNAFAHSDYESLPEIEI